MSRLGLGRRPALTIAIVVALVVVAGIVIAAIVGGSDDADTTGSATEATTADATTGDSSDAAAATSDDVATGGSATGDEPATATDAEPTGAPTDTATGEPTPPEGTLEILDPIDLESTGDFGSGLTVVLSNITAVEGEAELPGEIAGPALRIELVATNGSTEPIGLETMQVEVTYGPDRTPGIQLSNPNVVPFDPVVEPGANAGAAYVFGVPLDQRDQVQVIVMHTTDDPVLVFEGTAPTE